MFNLAIVTPEKIFYEGEVASLTVPGSEGYLGTLTDHAPLITAITPGKATLKDKSQQVIEMAVSYGFFEISNNKATLLVDSAEYATDIDSKGPSSVWSTTPAISIFRGRGGLLKKQRID
jgi:F-type H+-transporting ATPase subunit epsilon